MRKLTDAQFEKRAREATRAASLYVSVHGQLVKVHVPTKFIPKNYSHKRKDVTEFSRGSRKRMLEFSNTIAWEDVRAAKFLEMGYPDEIAARPYTVRTNDRNWFHAQLCDYLGRQVGAIWRVEWQERKSGRYTGMYLPHIHLLVFTDAFLPHAEVNRWWKTAIGWGGFVHTDVRSAKGSRMVAMYIAKYIGKVDPSTSLGIRTYLENGGRHWGYRYRSNIPRAEQLIFTDIRDGELFVFKRTANRVIPYFSLDSHASFTLFGRPAVEAAKEFISNRVANGRELG